MRRPGILVALVFALFLLLPPAVANGPGAGSAHLDGSFALSPSGTAGSIALLALSGLGEVEAGDELRYFWEANGGQGPAVHFEILRETPGSTAERVYGVVTAPTQTETWIIPAHAEYTASWDNPSSEAITLSYLFQVLHPVASPAFEWPLFLGLGVAGVVFALLFFWSGRRKGQEGEPSEPVEETGPPKE